MYCMEMLESVFPYLADQNLVLITTSYTLAVRQHPALKKLLGNGLMKLWRLCVAVWILQNEMYSVIHMGKTFTV